MTIAFFFALVFTFSNAVVQSVRNEIHCTPVDLNQKHLVTETVDGCFFSKSLKKNVNYSITFPKGYPSSAAPYPQIYFLHGRGGNNRQFREFCKSCDQRSPSTPCFSDDGPPALIIAPSQTIHTYWKNAVDGRSPVEDMIVKDLASHIERSKYVQKDSAGRGLLGISMGGHGALWMSFMHSDFFGKGTYAISPIFRNENSLLKEDRVGFGSGSEFKKKDPLTLIKSKPFLLNSSTYVEIANDDNLYKAEKSTQEFFKFVQTQQPTKVDMSRTGGHSLNYWCGALRRSMDFFKNNARPTKPSPEVGSIHNEKNVAQ